MTTTQADIHHRRIGVDARVVVGVDGGRTDVDAVRQACALAGDRGSIDVVCVRYGSGQGLVAQATIGHQRAEDAIDRACKAIHEAGVEAKGVIVEGSHAADGLLGHAAGFDALVVGSHGSTRAGGIAFGRVATVALHRSPIPVLIARRPKGDDFPGHVLVATDGCAASYDACDLAGALAGGGKLTMVSVGSQFVGERRHELARQSVELYESTGTMPTVVFEDGDPHDAIVRRSETEGVSLIVIGSGRKRGIRALGSTSERVAHEADCSVLVAR
jgi:nucleotide-binding universal stress UspA family protein